ncbi:FG-GAP-like repeat-containing protein [Streptomyces himalayensis]|uniref:FG-GAP repeat protein n=1 Tax=Streptomyces himalayensis subsp. himalayensis TaxID=2756131 RepID=A0A7W0DL34_9ACTN|nr:FG-GAP-like repeat-containing protein [Streptomyces himalayensis]MBA2947099.1 FG-GAP repeat protein [Streptomyces himalayensis subsp. himalayensis]
MSQPSRRRAVAAVAALLAAPCVVSGALAAPAVAATTGATPVVDFNGDGYADLAVSAPNGTVSGMPQAGYVSVVYGSSAGADTAHPQLITRATAGVPGDVSEYDTFGRSTAARDLDGDGYTDLVVGHYSTPVVLWGSASGLSGGTVLTTPSSRLAAGDFNGDGYGDLVTDSDVGLQVSYGPISRTGTPASTDTLPFDEEVDPRAIAVGDMTGDGVDDMVTTHSFEEMQYKSRFWAGGKDGLSHTYKTTGYYTVGGVITDVNKDGYSDFVALQVDQVSETRAYDAGAIRVVYGSASGPSTRTAKITQDTAGVPGVSEGGDLELNYGDQFGYSLAAGDVTGDGYPDIAAGVPGEDVGSVREAGAIVLLKGSAAGLTGSGAQAFHQSTSGVPGISEKGDYFGRSVLLGDVNANNRADLAVAAPNEDGTYADSGAVWVLRGSKAGLTTTNITSFGPRSLGAPEKGARFGDSFAR